MTTQTTTSPAEMDPVPIGDPAKRATAIKAASAYEGAFVPWEAPAPNPMPENVRGQIAGAYEAMAAENYRPVAPSDGCGQITAPVAELDLDAEALEYAERWWRREEACTFELGYIGHAARPAVIYALEASRLCCGPGAEHPYALRLARMAVAELEHLVEERGAGAEGEERS